VTRTEIQIPLDAEPDAPPSWDQPQFDHLVWDAEGVTRRERAQEQRKGWIWSGRETNWR
jgi:hypothetical protein